MGKEWPGKKFSPELESTLDDLSNKMNFIGMESSKYFVLPGEKGVDSMKETELKTTLKQAMSSLIAIESHNQKAAEIIRKIIVPNLKQG